MELFVSYQLPEHEEVAFNLAKEFGLTCLFQGDIDKKENNQSYFFIYKFYWILNLKWLVEIKSSLLIPGFLAKPDVIITTSESFVSE